MLKLCNYVIELHKNVNLDWIFFFVYTSEIAPTFAAERQCRCVDQEEQNQKFKFKAMYPFKCVTVFNPLTRCCINIFRKI